MNPMQILQNFLNKGGNPQDLVTRAIGMSGKNNPMIGNLMNMARTGNAKGIEQFARNYMKERGMDFDTEFANFMSNFKQG